MSLASRFRDSFASFVPVWLSDRPGKNVGFRTLWSMIAPLDCLAESYLQALQAPWPGVGTPSALPAIARTRGILRGFGTSETDAHFIGRLRAWLDTWREAGSAIVLAQQIHEYLSNRPRVRIVNRAGAWVTVEADGSISYATAIFDWDSISNPERIPWWSEMWILVYPDPWAFAPTMSLDALGRSTGLGTLCSQEEADALRGLIQQWKSAHSRVRAVVFTSDGTLFDPATPASLPDGKWGTWGIRGPGDSRLPSSRNTTTCRYMEPN